jgi:hypothetical protein
MYEKQSGSTKLLLMKRLFNMKLKESNSAASHINNFSQIITELTSQKLQIDGEVQALALLSSLPNSRDIFCTATSCSGMKLTYNNVVNAIFAEQIQRRSMDKPFGPTIRGPLCSWGRTKQRKREKLQEGAEQSDAKQKPWIRPKCLLHTLQKAGPQVDRLLVSQQEE